VTFTSRTSSLLRWVSYQVLVSLTGKVRSSTHMDDYGVNQDLSFRMVPATKSYGCGYYGLTGGYERR
jgi:hypothetical protein